MFVETITVLQKQYEFDASYTTLLERVINADALPTYNNSLLINHLFSLLQRQFPAVGENCDIERYCYELNYGFFGGKQVLTAVDLWDSLHNKTPLILPDIHE